MIEKDYLDLITSAFRQKAKFTAMIAADVAPLIQVQNLFTSMVPIFDVDTAVGTQLDIIGEWAGVTRNVSIPVTGIYFSWDADYFIGWEYGSWQSALAPFDVTSLPDDVYRTLIRAKIAANEWGGTTNGAYEIWASVFPTLTILIQDNQDMTYAFAIIGGVIDSLTLALFTGGYLPLKPEGVRISEYLVSVDTNPAFAWDTESVYLGGWDSGSWLREITAT